MGVVVELRTVVLESGGEICAVLMLQPEERRRRRQRQETVGRGQEGEGTGQEGEEMVGGNGWEGDARRERGALL